LLVSLKSVLNVTYNNPNK